MGDFEAEILKLGTAVVHDKIVVIDPVVEKPVVAIGVTISDTRLPYENDENLAVIRNNKALARACAVHILDVYDHHRCRACASKNKLEGKPVFTGHIDVDDRWLARVV